MSALQEIITLAQQVSVLRKASRRVRILRRAMAARQKAMEKRQGKIARFQRKYGAAGRHPSPSDLRQHQDHMQAYLQLDQEIKAMHYERSVLEKQVETLTDAEHALDQALRLAPRQDETDRERRALLYSIDFVGTGYRLCIEMDEAVAAGVRSLGHIRSITTHLAAGEIFNRIGKSYHETQVLKRIVEDNLRHSQALVAAAEPALQELFREVDEVIDILVSLHEMFTMDSHGLHYHEINELFDEISTTKERQDLQKKLDRLERLLDHLIGLLKRRKQQMMDAIATEKEQIIAQV